jgi:hypothetical protein
VRVPGSVRKGPRVGVDYAGEYWAAGPWRFKSTPGSAGPRSERAGGATVGLGAADVDGGAVKLRALTDADVPLSSTCSRIRE